MALLKGRDDWNMVADDCLLAGVAYLNEVGKLELTDYKDGMRLPELRLLRLSTMKGELPSLEDQPLR